MAHNEEGAQDPLRSAPDDQAAAGPQPPPSSGPARDCSGRWRPGASGNPRGRPRGPRPPISQIAEMLAAESGATLESLLAEILRTLIKQAAAGDVPACRYLLDRLSTDTMPGIRLEASSHQPVPKGQDLADYMRNLRDSLGTELAATPLAGTLEDAAQALELAVELDNVEHQRQQRELFS